MTDFGVGVGTIEGTLTSGSRFVDPDDALITTTRVTKILGRITGVATAVIAYRNWEENRTTGNVIRALSRLAVAGPNPWISVGIGILDVAGVSDQIYHIIGGAIDTGLAIYNNRSDII